MSDFLIGLFGILFFGGGWFLVFLKKREEIDWKYTLTSLAFVVVGFWMIIDSDVTAGKTVEMVTGDENFTIKDTIVAGDYEYTVKNKGTSDVLDDFGAEIHAQGKYLIIEVEIKNNTNYPYKMDTLMGTPFFIINEGRYYEVNKDLSRSLSNNELNSHHFWNRTGSTNPGNSVKGYLVFDIPKEIISSEETQLLILTDDSAPNDVYLNIN